MTDFLTNDEFISNANKNFDYIISEEEFNSEKDNFIQKIAYLTRKKNKILIVLLKTPVDIILPLIQMGKSIVFLVNQYSWILGFSKKGFWDLRDISKARDFWLNVFEPVYQEQIIDFIKNEKNSCYIRINKHIPSKIELPELKNKSDFFDFTKFWYSWTNWTIICFWSLIVDWLYWLNYLQNQWEPMDLFACYNYFFKLDSIFLNSIKSTWKLFIIIDQHLWSMYENWLKSIVLDSKIGKISINFITPNYKKISSVFEEYMYEQANIDWISIAKKIQEK